LTCRSELCRFNLHHLACQLLEQVKYRGLTVYHREDWVEREVGAAKRRTRGKLTNNPEVIALQLDLDERALQRVALELGVELDEDGGTGGDASAALVYGYGADRTGAVGVRDVGCAIRPETWAAIKVNRCCWLVGFLAPAWGCCRLLPPPHTHTGRGTAWSPGQRVLGR
jgi:hypothetical protein